MLRRSKAHVESEINLPACFEKTSIVTLGSIERTLYNTLHSELKSQLRAIKRNTAGGMLSMTAPVRAKFDQLRKVCVHPQVDTSGGQSAPVPMLTLLNKKWRDAKDEERVAAQAVDVAQSHLEADKRSLAFVLEDAEEAGQVHAAKEELRAAAYVESNRAQVLAVKQARTAVSPWLAAFGIPESLHKVLTGSDHATGKLLERLAAMDLDGSEEGLAPLRGHSAEDMRRAFTLLHEEDVDWRFVKWTAARAAAAAEAAEREASPWVVDAKAAAAEARHLAAEEAKEGTRAAREKLKVLHDDAVAAAKAETLVGRAARVTAENAVLACRSELPKQIMDQIVNHVNSDLGVPIAAMLDDEDIAITMNVSEFRVAALHAASAAGAVAPDEAVRAIREVFACRDASIASTEALARATDECRQTQRSVSEAQSKVDQTERGISRREKNCSTLKKAQEEKRRAAVFLKNQIESAEGEATRAAGAASAAAAASAGGAERERAADDDQDCCQICLEPYDDRVVTKCLHSYCSACIVGFIQSSRGGASKCPLCRQPVTEADLQKVTAPTLNDGNADTGRNSAKLIYLIAQIEQHIADAPADRPFKCLVFSSWTKVLDIVSDALNEAGIGFESFVKTREKAVDVFDKNAKAHVSSATIYLELFVFASVLIG